MKLTTAKGHYVEIPNNEFHTHTGHAYEKYGHYALGGGYAVVQLYEALQY
jgi:hypothetical protein